MTPTLLSAFWTYTLITAMTPGPNNILALSSATSHGFRQSTRVLAGMSLGFLIVMLLCAGISFSLAVIDPAAVHLLSWRQRFAGDDWDVWQCVLGAGGASVSAIVSPVWSPVKYRACPVAGLLRGTHFLLTKKSGRGRPLPLSNLLLKPYRLSVKVRAITSRCCSGVRELKRTA